MCAQDDKCRFHMYIDAHPDDMDSYREVVNHHPTARRFIDPTFCSERGTDLLKQMWIENTYQTHHICDDPNEIFVRDIGCICRPGRRCNVKNVLDHVLGINRHDLFILAIAIAFVGSVGYVVTKFKTITTAIGEFLKEKKKENVSSQQPISSQYGGSFLYQEQQYQTQTGGDDDELFPHRR